MNDPEDIFIEDAPIACADPDGWITLPGSQGRISPNGVVYDKNGEPLYSLYEDNEAPLSIYMGDEDDYEWM